MAPSGKTDLRRKADILAPLTLFEECSTRELESVAEVSVEATVRPGTILTYEGQVGGLVYVIVDGEAAVTSHGQQVGTLRAGDLAGELSLIDGQPRSAEVRATTALKVLEINSDDFTQLMAKSPRLSQNLMRALAGRIRDANAHLPEEG